MKTNYETTSKITIQLMKDEDLIRFNQRARDRSRKLAWGPSDTFQSLHYLTMRRIDWSAAELAHRGLTAVEPTYQGRIDG